MDVRACLRPWLAAPAVPLLPQRFPSSSPAHQDWLRMLERMLKLSIPTLYW